LVTRGLDDLGGLGGLRAQHCQYAALCSRCYRGGRGLGGRPVLLGEPIELYRTVLSDVRRRLHVRCQCCVGDGGADQLTSPRLDERSVCVDCLPGLLSHVDSGIHCGDGGLSKRLRAGNGTARRFRLGSEHGPSVLDQPADLGRRFDYGHPTSMRNVCLRSRRI
jgi:hypothetical protein